MSLTSNVLNAFKKESPMILGILGAAGVAVTAVSVAKATPKATAKLDELKEKAAANTEEVKTIDKVKVLTPVYAPSIAIGAATIACIIGSTVLNNKQRIALTSAYVMLDQGYKQYKDKVDEFFGVGSAKQIDHEITKEKLEKAPEPFDGDTCIFYEKHQDKFFERSMLEVQDAMYHLNRKLAQDGEVSLNDFYDLLSLDRKEEGDVLGWSSYLLSEKNPLTWIDYELDLVKADDGMECYEIVLVTEPTADYYVPF